MGVRLDIFALLISLVLQSLLTVGCGADRLSPATGDDVQLVAVDLPDGESMEGYCGSCGGLRTVTGCCAHGAPLTAAIAELPAAAPVANIPALPALPLPERNPTSLFRPPIPA